MDLEHLIEVAIVSDPIVVLAVGLLIFSLTGLLTLLAAIKSLSKLIDAYTGGRAREIKSAQNIADALSMLNAGADQQHNLNTKQVELLETLSATVVSSNDQIQNIGRQTSILFDRADRTELLIGGIPQRLAEEIKPLADQIEQLRGKLDEAKTAADGNHTRLSMDLMRLETILAFRLNSTLNDIATPRSAKHRINRINSHKKR